MRKFVAIGVITLLLIAPLLIATPVLAVNDLTFDADTTIDLSNPDTNITILDGSKVDSMTVNAGSIEFTISDGGDLILRSTERKTLTHNSKTISTDITCNNAYSQLIVTPDPTSSGESITVTVSSATCTISGGSVSSGGGGGGGGGGADTTPTTTETTTETPTAISTEPTPGQPTKDSAGNITLGQMTTDASTVASGDVSQVIAKMGVTRDTAAEANYNETVVSKVVAGSGITAQVRNTITNFVTYGTPATKSLGAGERGGVVNSYRAAFGKVPSTVDEWNDVVKIANGRWPSVTNTTAENRAKISFRTIYLRNANMDDANDNAAVTVMAYGLRPANRNLDSEKTAIKSFKAIFNYAPTSATNWDAVRAVAYSGATR